jgi:enoyl-CoA hydratase/carnithine racemase
MQYTLEESIAIVDLDDGKANVVGPELIKFVNESLDRVGEDEAGAVLLRGREGMFSAGFDLAEFQKGAEQGIAMVKGGIELAIRLYSYPAPVVAACSGHGIAMGAFLLLSCDSRIGVRGDYKITLPETRINMEIPHVLQVLCAARLSPRHMTQALAQAQVYSPDEAVEVGFLDSVVEADELDEVAMRTAQELAALPQKFYAANKLYTRQETLERMQSELEKTLGALDD